MAIDKESTDLTKKEQDQVNDVRLQLKIDQVARGFSVLNENQVALMYRRTPKRATFQRPARGQSKPWTYVKKGHVRKQLDSLFGFDWNWIKTTSLTEELTVAERTGFVVVEGYIEGRVRDAKTGSLTTTLKRYGTGRAAVKFEQQAKEMPDGNVRRAPLDFGNDVKAAETDALKRAAAAFGISSDIYEAEEFFDLEIIGSDDQSERNKNVQREVDKAKAILNTPGTKVKPYDHK